MMSHLRQCRGLLSRSAKSTSGGWGGRFPGHPRSVATSTSTSMCGLPKSNSAREALSITTIERPQHHPSRSQERPFEIVDRAGGKEQVREEFAFMSGTDVATYTRERPGMSAFVLEDGVVYHTYSTFARGLDGLWGMSPVA